MGVVKRTHAVETSDLIQSSSMSDSVHLSVLPQEVIESLALKPGQTVVDGTLGGGGHTRMLAEQVGPEGLVLALDRDVIAIERAERELSELPVRPYRANFCDLPEAVSYTHLTLPTKA